MKAIRFMLLLSFIGIVIMSLVVACKVKTTKEVLTIDTTITWETASFYPQYIIEMTEAISSIGDTCYWLIYDDLDAGFDNEIISMDKETYLKASQLWTSRYKQEINSLLDEWDLTIYNDNGICVLLSGDKD